MNWYKISECMPIKANMYEVIYEDMISGYAWIAKDGITFKKLRSKDHKNQTSTDKQILYWLENGKHY